jgi:hypothetical protein
MKRYILYIVVFLFFVMGCASSKIESKPYLSYYEYTSLPPNEENKKFFEYENGFLAFHLLEETCFYLKGSKPKVICLFEYKEYRNKNRVRPQYDISKININNKMVPFSEKQFDPIIKGNTIVIPLEITVGDQTFTFNFNVQEVPVSLGMSYKEMIDILGQPNNEEKYSVDTWGLGSVFLDGHYSNRFVDTWELVYDKYLGKKFYLDKNGILEAFY